ncbi:hypothetical protein [Austwickia sp. TVS 96-490-7B]|uniref:hypothetical protein n=1 Tax=Austwickia sp. TVS 96-490-7B TaxID=2830843 RepID=UPI001C59833C|nr:hypothetical protein [Austwickia sp. TVS 96-490-7B]
MSRDAVLLRAEPGLCGLVASDATISRTIPTENQNLGDRSGLQWGIITTAGA